MVYLQKRVVNVCFFLPPESDDIILLFFSWSVSAIYIIKKKKPMIY